MNKIHYIIALFFAVAFGLSVSSSHPVQGNAGYTAAPGDSFCTSCHIASPTLNGTVTVTGLPAEIMPNVTYTLTVTLTNTVGSAVFGGFQLLALNGNNQNSGTFDNSNTPNTSIKVVSGGRTYFGHEPAINFPGSGVLTWDVDWTAPPTAATGVAKFYVAGNITNGNGGSNRDRPVAFNIIVPFQATMPDPISLTISNLINPSCFDTQDGSATVNIMGGTPPFNILWNNGENTATANSLSGGTISVTVTDSGTGSSSRSSSLVTPQPVNVNVSTFDESCFGSFDGSAFASATGGTGNKTFSWSNGGQGSFQNNLTAGNYSVTATDVNGCQDSENFTIQSPDQILIHLIERVDPTCFGGSNGYIVVEAEGGSGNITYTWSNGATGPSISNLTVGNYSVTVTDNNSCRNSAQYQLVSPLNINITFPVLNHVTCFGQNNGSVTASASGGNGNFSYVWSNGNTGPSIQNLSPGTYTVTVQDIEGCTKTSSVMINEPPPITITLIDLDPASCSGANDGGIVVEATGQFTPFLYNWSNGVTTAANLNIPAGNYSVTVTDPNQCTQTAAYTVGTNAPFVLSLVNTSHVTCFGEQTGSIQVEVNPPGNYNYNWSNGATGSLITNLGAGTYTCTATDASGCASSPVSTTVTQPSELQSNVTILQSLACYGDTDGQISLNPSDGTPPYQFLWGDGSSEDTLTHLSAGIYTLILEDSNGCMVADTVVLVQPDSLYIQLLTLDTLLCHGDDDGDISVQIEGGTGELSLLWSTGDTTTTINNVTAGVYSISVEDANGCFTEESYSVLQPDPIITEAIVTPVTPGSGQDGAIHLQVMGGSGTYQFVWSNGETGNFIDSLTIGEYSVTVTDENNCIEIYTYLIPLTDCLLSATAITTDANCFGGMDGKINVNIENPIGNFRILLFENSILLDVSLDSLKAGLYEIRVVDSAFCTIILDSLVILEGDEIILTQENIIHPTPDQSNGAVEVEASGGAGGFIFEWFNSLGQKISEDKDLRNVPAGTYELVVTDSLNCSIAKEYILEERVSTVNPGENPDMVIYPNPTSGDFTLQFNEQVFIEKLILYNSMGQMIENIEVNAHQSAYTFENLNLISGLIYIQVQFNNYTMLKKILIRSKH